jgi:hypothetical protein
LPTSRWRIGLKWEDTAAVIKRLDWADPDIPAGFEVNLYQVEEKQ